MEENKQHCRVLETWTKGKPSRKESTRKQNNVTSLICSMDNNISSTDRWFRRNNFQWVNNNKKKGKKKWAAKFEPHGDAFVTRPQTCALTNSTAPLCAPPSATCAKATETRKAVMLSGTTSGIQIRNKEQAHFLHSDVDVWFELVWARLLRCVVYQGDTTGCLRKVFSYIWFCEVLLFWMQIT